MLAFHLGKIPVRVHPAFLIMGAFLGMRLGSNIAALAMWIVVLFVSVMAHELGHAYAGIGFGLDPQIDLHGMGGTTSWRHKDVSTAKKILISIAGPAVGIFFGGILYFAEPGIMSSDASRMLKLAVDLGIQVNLYWGALNLLPIMPLDGGNAMATALGGGMGEKGLRIARYVSVVVAVGGGLYWFVTHPDIANNWWPLLLAAMFTFQNIQALKPATTTPVRPQQW
jgi:Zn-dependent protease